MPGENTDAERFLPLTPAVLHILLALADGDKHGYAIMKDVEMNTGGQVLLGPGTLYGCIKRLLESGLLAQADERPDPDMDDQRRRYYTLTAQGRTALHAEVLRQEALLRLAQRKHVMEAL